VTSDKPKRKKPLVPRGFRKLTPKQIDALKETSEAEIELIKQEIVPELRPFVEAEPEEKGAD
jgi:hypothetical protein